MRPAEVVVERKAEGEDKDTFLVSVRGFDDNTKTGDVESGDANRIALWMLDPDHDGRSLFPGQVSSRRRAPRMVGRKLARNLGVDIDADLIETYRATIFLPITIGEQGSHHN